MVYMLEHDFIFLYLELQCFILRCHCTPRQDAGSHLKSFAGETLEAAWILNAFAQLVLPGCYVLPEHQRSLQLLCRMLEILGSGDDAKRHLPEFSRCVVLHAQISGQVYPHIGKPKFHYCFHLAACLERFGNLSCFATERKHKTVKAIAGRVSGDGLQKHLNIRCLAEDIRRMDRGVLCPCALQGPVKEESQGRLASVKLVLPEAVVLRSSKKMLCKIVA